jgi:hypothetical protein
MAQPACILIWASKVILDVKSIFVSWWSRVAFFCWEVPYEKRKPRRLGLRQLLFSSTHSGEVSGVSSELALLGSWFLAPGSWLLALGSWPLAVGS